MCQVGTFTVDTGVGVGVGVEIGVGVGEGAAEVGGVGVGLAVGCGVVFAEAPTLPQPVIASPAAAKARAAGILKRCKTRKMVVTFRVTRVKADDCGRMGE